MTDITLARKTAPSSLEPLKEKGHSMRAYSIATSQMGPKLWQRNKMEP